MRQPLASGTNPPFLLDMATRGCALLCEELWPPRNGTNILHFPDHKKPPHLCNSGVTHPLLYFLSRQVKNVDRMGKSKAQLPRQQLRPQILPHLITKLDCGRHDQSLWAFLWSLDNQKMPRQIHHRNKGLFARLKMSIWRGQQGSGSVMHSPETAALLSWSSSGEEGAEASSAEGADESTMPEFLCSSWVKSLVISNTHPHSL